MITLPARCSLALAAALAATLACADTRVYRCESAGQVTYSDLPCAGARVLAIDAGAAAPDARERLRRDQDALDARSAQRRDALAREAALARMEPARPESMPVDAAPAANDAGWYGYGVWAPVETRPNERHRDGERERLRRTRSSVIPQPPPTPLRGSHH